MADRSVVVLSGARTAIGTYGGTLKDIPPTQLAATVVRESVKRANVEPKEVGHVVFGNVIHTDARDMYLSRVATIEGGLPHDTPALTLNRLCGSGLQAIVSAAQTVLLGDAEIAIGGGAESMSRGLYGNTHLRWGARMGEVSEIDMMVGALTDPFDTVHMGITAENVAEKHGISRQMQDEFAVESQRRASTAISKGHFKEQIVPVEIKTRKGTTMFDTDEHPRAETTLDAVAKLKPAFKRDGGSVTAGNASGINDAAAAVVLMEESAAKKRGLKPMARMIAYGHAGVDPKYMGIGPVPAVRRARGRAGPNK
jgi:acetyl-CoA C-acetyltransferase